MPYKDPLKKKKMQQAYSKKHYEGNADKVRAATKKRHGGLKDEWRKFKATLSCLECEVNHPAVLDFHHIDPEMKNASVHKLIQARNYTAAMEEVQQCMVLCANCHRVYHHNERQRAKEKGAEAPPQKV